jgi:hypothetical protein
VLRDISAAEVPLGIARTVALIDARAPIDHSRKQMTTATLEDLAKMRVAF